MRYPLALGVLLAATIATAVNPTYLGEKPPLFRFGEFANATVPFEKLTDLEGDVVLVVFLRTACPGCRAAMPDLDRIRKKHDRPDFHVFATTNDSRDLMRRFLVHESVGRKLNVPIAIRSQAAWGVTKLPWAYVVGRDGLVWWAGHPSRGYAKAVAAALKAPDPSMPGSRAPRAALERFARRDFASVLTESAKLARSEETAALGRWLEERVRRESTRGLRRAELHEQRGDTYRAYHALVETRDRFRKTPLEGPILDRLAKLVDDDEARLACERWKRLHLTAQAARKGGRAIRDACSKLRPMAKSGDERLARAALEWIRVLEKPWTIEDAANMGGGL